MLVAKTLSHTDDKGKLWIRVANLSDKPSSIKRGKSIAQAEDTEEVDVFPIEVAQEVYLKRGEPTTSLQVK